MEIVYEKSFQSKPQNVTSPRGFFEKYKKMYPTFKKHYEDDINILLFIKCYNIKLLLDHHLPSFKLLGRIGKQCRHGIRALGFSSSNIALGFRVNIYKKIWSKTTFQAQVYNPRH